jgi:glycerophosphoryl diester phosphodiesterase
MKIYAHRGFSYKYPEASRLAYEKAIEVGADGFECDIRLTSDGVPICFHDRTTERISGRKVVVSKSDLATLRREVDVVTLEELIELALTNGRNLIIETKHPVRTGGRVEREVLKRVKGIESKQRITLISFSMRATLRMRRKYSDVGYVIGRWWRALVIPTQLVAIDIELYRKSKFVRRRVSGKEIFLWTVNDPECIPLLKSWPISAVITDRPDLDF